MVAFALLVLFTVISSNTRQSSWYILGPENKHHALCRNPALPVLNGNAKILTYTKLVNRQTIVSSPLVGKSLAECLMKWHARIRRAVGVDIGHRDPTIDMLILVDS